MGFRLNQKFWQGTSWLTSWTWTTLIRSLDSRSKIPLIQFSRVVFNISLINLKISSCWTSSHQINVKGICRSLKRPQSSQDCSKITMQDVSNIFMNHHFHILRLSYLRNRDRTTSISEYQLTIANIQRYPLNCEDQDQEKTMKGPVQLMHFEFWWGD